MQSREKREKTHTERERQRGVEETYVPCRMTRMRMRTRTSLSSFVGVSPADLVADELLAEDR